MDNHHNHHRHQPRFADNLRKRRNKQDISLAIDAVSDMAEVESLMKVNINEDDCCCYMSPQLSSADYSEAVFGGIPYKDEEWWDSSTSTSPITNKTITPDPCSSLKGTFLKWALITLNVVIEACQATITQESSQGEMGRPKYLNLTLIISSICFVMSFVEAFHEAKGSRSFWVYFGIVCSTVQLIVNLISKFMNRDFVKFDYVPLLLSVCYFASAIIGCFRGMAGLLGTVKCRSHGYNQVEGVVVDGCTSPVFECPKCRGDIP